MTDGNLQLDENEARIGALLRSMTEDDLEFAAPPADLWKWCEDVLLDDGAAPVEPRGDVSLSQWLRGLLTDQKYFGTILPRIPPNSRNKGENTRTRPVKRRIPRAARPTTSVLLSPQLRCMER